MKKNTDLSSFLASGGQIKKGQVKRAKGTEEIIYYSIGPLKAIKYKKPRIPSHFSTKKHEWETEENVKEI